MPETRFTAAGGETFLFSVAPVYPGRVEVGTGLTLGVTEGGTSYAYGKGRPSVLHTLRFEDMPANDFDGGFDYAAGMQDAGTQSLVNWFMNVAPPGSGGFTYADAFGILHEVEFADARLEFSLSGLGRYSGTLKLREYVGQP